MVQLAGDTVAEVMAEQGRITAAEKADIKAELGARQDAIKPAIQALGGQVLADYQVAYNGIKVRINPNSMERLRALPGVIGVHFIPNHERDNAISVPYLGVPTVWSSPNFIRGLEQARSRSSTPASTSCTGTSGPRVPWRPRLNTQPRTPPTRFLRTRRSSAPAPRRSRAGSTSSATTTTRAEAARS